MDVGMATEQARKFQTGITSRAEHRSFEFSRHFAECCYRLNFAVEAYLSIIMHKYSSILNGLAELSSFSDDCKKKFLLDSTEQGHLV
jgi:ribosomal protein RSM22 (predicted rRNA methylase)